ncbi:MAG TPA: glycosyltransferase family 39 protein [Planctomycetota bacterium]|nr:glycosyltransferase family 39 protein [Planctomycetota bacterium]
MSTIVDSGDRTRWIWRGALIFSAVFHLLHYIALPVLITVDGADYILLGRLAAALNFSEEYYFARPPLYPLLIEYSTRLLGRNAMAVQVPNLLLGFGAIWLAGTALKALNFPRAAAGLVVLLTLYPTFAAYEHCVLTETGSVFFLFLTIWLLVRSARNEHDWRWSIVLGVVLGISYHHRPTLLYLAPVWAVLRMFQLRGVIDRGHILPWKQALSHAAAIMALGIVIALPWQIVMSRSEERHAGGELLLIFLLKQAVLPPDDPLLADIREDYEQGIADATVGGRLDAAGIHQYTLRRFQEKVTIPKRPEGSRIFIDAVATYPGRYIDAVWRTALLLCGAATADDENGLFTSLVISEVNHGGKVLAPRHPLYVQLQHDFAQRTNDTHISRTLERLRGFYAVLLMIAVLMNIIVVIAAVFVPRLRPAWLFALPALAFLVMHAIVLFATTRYAFPVYPLLLANLILIPALLVNREQAQPTSA